MYTEHTHTHVNGLDASMDRRAIDRLALAVGRMPDRMRGAGYRGRGKTNSCKRTIYGTPTATGHRQRAGGRSIYVTPRPRASCDVVPMAALWPHTQTPTTGMQTGRAPPVSTTASGQSSQGVVDKPGRLIRDRARCRSRMLSARFVRTCHRHPCQADASEAGTSARARSPPGCGCRLP